MSFGHPPPRGGEAEFWIRPKAEKLVARDARPGPQAEKIIGVMIRAWLQARATGPLSGRPPCLIA